MGPGMFVTPGIVIDGKLVTTASSTSISGSESCWAVRITTTGTDQEMFVKNDPLGQSGRPPASVEPAHQSAPAETRHGRQVQLGDVAAVVRRHRSSRAGHRRRAAGAAVGDRPRGPRRHRVREGDRAQRADQPAEDRAEGPGRRSNGRSRSGSNTIERDRARTYFQAYAAACALHFAEKALDEIRAGHTKTWEKFEVPDEGIGCGFTEAVRGVLSHHMVIRDSKIANYHPYPPTPWNANPRDSFGTPGPYEDAVQGRRFSRRTTGSTSRASTSCGPSAVSIHACPVASTCTSARERRWRSCIRPPSP